MHDEWTLAWPQAEEGSNSPIRHDVVHYDIIQVWLPPDAMWIQPPCGKNSAVSKLQAMAGSHEAEGAALDDNHQQEGGRWSAESNVTTHSL